MDKVGVNGIVTVEKSMTSETYAEVTNGIKVEIEVTPQTYLSMIKEKMSVYWKMCKY